jgi:thymidylate synthase
MVARSIDTVKGLPFNVASYALMLHMMAAITGCKPGTLLVTITDCHIYDNQFADVEEQLKRAPYPLPQLDISAALRACKDLTIDEAHALDPSMFKLLGYQHHEKLKSESEVAV